MPRRERKLRFNRARRHFLGVAAAAGARIAAIGAFFRNCGFCRCGQRKGQGQRRQGWFGPMCLLRGTAIMTPGGEVSIEDLRIGDLVETMRGEALPVKWIGRHVYRRRSLTWNEEVVPVESAVRPGWTQPPQGSLYLPGHALYIDGVLLRATDLVNGSSIAPAFPREVEVIEILPDNSHA